MGGLMRGGIVAAVLAVGCGGDVELQAFNATASGGTGGAGLDGALDATTGGVDGSGLPPGADADSPTEADLAFPWICKDAGAAWGHMSCCNGHVCLGDCESGSCHCGGMDGGCVPPSICCNPFEDILVCGGPPICVAIK